jgi:anti-repressor protein
MVNDEPYFVGKDIAEALGYKDTRQAIRNHVREKHKTSVEILGGGDLTPPLDKQTVLIKEAGLYQLIMRSNLESAEEFQDWVIEEVLPSIRKTGSYSKKLTPLEHMKIANDMLLEEVKEKDKQIERNKKLIESLNLIEYSSTNSDTTITIEEVCKIVSDSIKGSMLGRTKAYHILRSMNFVTKKNTTPTQQAISRGYLNYVKHLNGYMTVIYTDKANKLIKLMAKHLQENEHLNEALNYPFEPQKRERK